MQCFEHFNRLDTTLYISLQEHTHLLHVPLLVPSKPYNSEEVHVCSSVNTLSVILSCVGGHISLPQEGTFWQIIIGQPTIDHITAAQGSNHQVMPAQLVS